MPVSARTIVVTIAFLSLVVSSSIYAQQNTPGEDGSFARLLNSDPMVEINPEKLSRKFADKPFQAFDFVRDHIAFENYYGILRGARGTLLSKAGNAWDQAVLLRTLLNSSDIRVQLLRGRLSKADANVLLANVRTQRNESGSDLIQKLVSLTSEKNKLFPDEKTQFQLLKVPDVNSIKEQAEKFAKPLEEEIQDDLAENQQLVEDYIWVRIYINEVPYDFHPAFPKGATVDVTPLGIMENVTSVPQEMFHWVRIRLFAERRVSEGSQRMLLLENRLLAAAVSGRTITVGLNPRFEDSLVTIKPEIRLGDLQFSGEEKSFVSAHSTKEIGKLTAFWAEFTILSPLKRPRARSVTILDAIPADSNWRKRSEQVAKSNAHIADEQLKFSLDFVILNGVFDEDLFVEQSITTFDRLSRLKEEKKPDENLVENSVLFDFDLLQWMIQMSKVIEPASTIVSPSIALSVTSPDGSTIERKGGVVFFESNGRIVEGVAASLLFMAIAGEQISADIADKLQFEANKPALENHFSNLGWEWSTLMELQVDQMRGDRIYIDPEIEGFWINTEDKTNASLLKGASGWLINQKLENDSHMLSGVTTGEWRRYSGGYMAKETFTSLVDSFVREVILSRCNSAFSIVLENIWNTGKN